jgi:Myb-like DNA-binding domain
MDKDYGRLFVRTRFCSLLVDACSEPGYSDSSLVAWEPNDWHDFIDDLAQTKEACLLPECHHVFGLGPDHEQPNVELNAEERAQLMAFTKKYTVIEKACQVSLHLSPFRLSLEQQIAAGDTGPPKDVSPEFVQTLFVTAKNNDSFVIRRHLLRLFISDPVPEGKESANLEAINPQPILRNVEELKEILGAKPFSLLWFQSRLEQLVWMWNEACYGLQQPYLQLISYHEIDRRNPGTPRSRRASRTPATPPRPPPPGNTEVLATLKRRREALRENHGADPLSESRRIAKVLKKNILHDGKKSKMMVAFEDSDEEEEVIAPARRLPNNNAEEKEDNEENAPPGERVRLPAMPEHAAGAANDAPVPVGTKIYTGPPPDEGIFDVTGNVVRRHPWTDEEIAALTLGYAKYGAGKWVHIKQEYGYILRNRTTVQIKDKFRNMQRRGELPDAV